VFSMTQRKNNSPEQKQQTRTQVREWQNLFLSPMVSLGARDTLRLSPMNNSVNKEPALFAFSQEPACEISFPNSGDLIHGHGSRQNHKPWKLIEKVCCCVS
jgi:hypothetical protein